MTLPPDPRVSQTPKSKQVTGENTLSNIKCPFTSLNFSRAAPGPGWPVNYNKEKLNEKNF